MSITQNNIQVYLELLKLFFTRKMGKVCFELKIHDGLITELIIKDEHNI